MKARTVEVHIGGAQVQPRGGRRRDETVEFCYPILIEGIQSTTKGIIVQLRGGHPGRDESVGGLMLEEPGDQVERLIDTPQAIEHHRFDRFTRREVPLFRVLLSGVVDHVANPQFVEHASHKAEMIQNLTPVRRLRGHNNLLCW